mmetsp:Transcript_3496/g.5047  ORF Transcript_3496/g.5047 Transcript_3496/m.5047 type:complete len:643 (+) Transcript_3496:158-2086(+)|eukprot:CAMPEP_0203759394 /NCGR_PEP_ID=MMETSP0098-20131031/12400_1 /ASSEMBLY_ACC=CAM_ASM_000208 /TAXON_ID=96639 /ORGANISM=" , Strain NY0313808BC1" /LENGTH=642 /DNA_ID=CAMNT_0050652309 /DNA_START=124 /DNA_END=2052 /DNA_ORIENTATION=+
METHGCWFFEKGFRSGVQEDLDKEGFRRTADATGSIHNFVSENNRRGFERFWGQVEKRCRRVVEERDTATFGDVCSFFKNKDQVLMRAAVLYTGMSVSDNGLSCEHVDRLLRASISPNTALLRQEHCASISSAVDSLTNQLYDNMDTTSKFKNRSSLRVGTNKYYDGQRLSSLKRKRKLDMFSLESLYKENREDQVLVVVEDVENIDGHVLEQLVEILLEFNLKVQVGIVFGMRWSNSKGLHRFLNRRHTARLLIGNFKSCNSLTMLEHLFEDLLLRGGLPLHVSPRATRALSDHFLSEEYSVSGFMRALKLIVLDHFQKRHGAFLLCTDQTGFQLDMNDIDCFWELPSVRARTRGKAISAEEKRDSILEFAKRQRGWERWPRIFSLVRIAYLELFEISAETSWRQVFHKMHDNKNDPMKSVEMKMKECSLGRLENIVKSWVNCTGESFLGLGELYSAFVALRAAASKETEPETPEKINPARNLNKLGSKKRREELLGCTTIKPRSKPSEIEARKIVQTFWERKIALHWDVKSLPLGELFYTSGKSVVKTLRAKSRAMIEAMENPPPNIMSHDTCVVFHSIMKSEKTSLLALYETFYDQQKQKQKKHEECRARFIHAVTELQYLGVIISRNGQEQVTNLLLK